MASGPGFTGLVVVRDAAPSMLCSLDGSDVEPCDIVVVDPNDYDGFVGCTIIGTVRTPLLFTYQLAEALSAAEGRAVDEFGADWVIDDAGLWHLLQIKGFRLGVDCATAVAMATAASAATASSAASHAHGNGSETRASGSTTHATSAPSDSRGAEATQRKALKPVVIKKPPPAPLPPTHEGVFGRSQHCLPRIVWLLRCYG